MWIEANIDGLVGPSHHFGGLGVGNLASHEHAGQVSHPRKAALQGLRKMQLVASLGIPQFLWLPPWRPNWQLLANLGFRGPPPQRLAAALAEQPQALSAAFSGAFMWVANAATITPACDSADGRDHITPANLIASWHRAGEAAERRSELELFFPSPRSVVHQPLSAIVPLRDEGAANHMRLCAPAGDIAFHLFVYGADGEELSPAWQFLPRQTRAASEAIARRHRLSPDRVVGLRQHPHAISAGVFHNDVIATSHLNVLVHHELAFLDAEQVLDDLEGRFYQTTGVPLVRRVVRQEEMSVQEAVASYFFNSQILSPPLDRGRGGVDVPKMLLLCPRQCQQSPAAGAVIKRLLADPEVPIDHVEFVSLDESMAGGGGPACLRLRMWTQRQNLATLPASRRVTSQLVDRLGQTIERWYPHQLTLPELAELAVVEQIDEATRRVHQCVASL
ncbi:MAG: N-succinylarginine dihydrolase [Pirellulaceae bacterium]|nr:MAG: N-succinylarginine dihydrolase [Pirellulaceae bacterium]